MYCENYKIGSSTWAMHLLKMKKIPVGKRTPIHLLARKKFPPITGKRKSSFLARQDTISFIIARDPFERILSSYRVF